MVLASYGIPFRKIEKGKKKLTVTPAYIQADSLFNVANGNGDDVNRINTSSQGQSILYTENDATGGGAVVSWFHGLGESWGYSVIVSHIQLSGETAAFAEYDSSGAQSALNFADEDGHATQVFGLLVYDPLSHYNKISLPIFLGAGFYYASQEAEFSKVVNVTNLSNVQVNYNAEINTLTAGLTLGAAFQFNTWDFRWNPFLMVFFAPDPPEYDVTATRGDTGASLLNSFTQEEDPDTVFPSGGISVTYEPWDVSATWIPNWFHVLEGSDDTEETNQSIITFSKSWTWN